MPIITVYSFRYHDKQQGLDVLGAGKCTREEIAKKGWMIIESSAEEIDSSLLTATGRYCPPQPGSKA